MRKYLCVETTIWTGCNFQHYNIFYINGKRVTENRHRQNIAFEKKEPIDTKIIHKCKGSSSKVYYYATYED